MVARRRKPLLKRLVHKARKYVQESIELWCEFLAFLYKEVLDLLYKHTLPVTSRYLSRRPTPPKVEVKDIRAKRIRLNIESSYASPFNVEQFEVRWRHKHPQPSQRPAEEVFHLVEDEAERAWASIGYSDLTQRTVARLTPDTEYQFQVRASNKCGISGWSSVVDSATRIDPVDGGGRGPNHKFTWTQSSSDICINLKLPLGTSKRDVALDLQSDHLAVHLKTNASAPSSPSAAAHCGSSGTTPQVALEPVFEGELWGLVQDWDHGSNWVMTKESDHVLLSITLEKKVKSIAPKFDYWRAISPGDPEIDTHQITSESQEGGGPQMISPGSMDPRQLQSMGLGHFSHGGPPPQGHTRIKDL